ncbi:glycoside hydrolase family 15 protein [Amniculicola lignicola CBS 123094]|uniref:Glycoside hydrolase family 15 protein n=1 Tax=Amniculicola lignicola CBS 123094 TaxID=1392246 RepID=A0A6A5WGM4_9PLEO|nr:glycoside hydrolase family 15 protein [Amniculicola lignicola CBS 123094]
MRSATGYVPGLIRNMRTCALVTTDGGLGFMCWQGNNHLAGFDSPSLFCRLLDKDKGGHFSIGLMGSARSTAKQQYLPSSDILQTRYLNEEGVTNVVDFFPRPTKTSAAPNLTAKQSTPGSERLYLKKVIFYTKDPSLELNATIDCGDNPTSTCPAPSFRKEAGALALGEGITASFHLRGGQAVSFVLRGYKASDPEHITTALVDQVQLDTHDFWVKWITKSKWKGRWSEVVTRSFFALKLLAYEPTGVSVAAPTFSLAEDFGGSFTIYILLRLGFTEEAEAYTESLFNRTKDSRTLKGDITIIVSIRGGTDLPETKLSHLEGYRASQPVRIDNSATFHKQLDIYGEMMDGIYLANKFGKPISYDQWHLIRELTNHVCKIWKEDDMTIWEDHALGGDRALRLADKRCFHCPNRWNWLRIRDEIYEDVMERGYNHNLRTFIQGYEEMGVKGDDGVGGQEGAFSMCTFWHVESLTRVGAYDKKYLCQAVTNFDNIFSYGNLHMFSKEIAKCGEQFGNTPQAFGHLALISVAFNLNRITSRIKADGLLVFAASAS